ncbi:hypothetical protein C8F01DRAFT_1256150 [Mycena amicta]|nr:hypothetical protein C8F01DRAFT_1256150 [Mycena amicta]
MQSNLQLLDQIQKMQVEFQQQQMASMQQMQASFNQQLNAQMEEFRAQGRTEFNAMQTQRDEAQRENGELKNAFREQQHQYQQSQQQQHNRVSTSHPAAPVYQALPAPASLTPTTAPASTAGRHPNRASTSHLAAASSPAYQAPPAPASGTSSTPPTGPASTARHHRNRVSTLHPAAASSSAHQAPPPSTSSTLTTGPASTAGCRRAPPRNALPEETAVQAPKRRRRLGEHQIQQRTLDKSKGFELHLRFLWRVLQSNAVPISASRTSVDHFNRRFEGRSVTELRQQGELGQPLVNPAHVKLGISIQDAVRSTKRILKAFAQLKEGALLHMCSYLSKLGILEWAPDYEQTPYSQYNVAMRLCAIHLFRFLTSSTAYDFLAIDMRYLNDVAFITRIYDHFVHHYMYNKWTSEIRAPGANETAGGRNTSNVARKRLYQNRMKFIEESTVPGGIKSLLHAKATSDTESTPSGPYALACPERSASVDLIIRKIDDTTITTYRATNRARQATALARRQVDDLLVRRASSNLNLPAKGMPIQYYDPTWWNMQPEVLRKALKPVLIVVFPPLTPTDFFTSRSKTWRKDVAQLTAKYGDKVFDQYNLDYLNASPPPEELYFDDDDESMDDVEEDTASDTGSTMESTNPSSNQGVESDSDASFIDDGESSEDSEGDGNSDLGSDADDKDDMMEEDIVEEVQDLLADRQPNPDMPNDQMDSDSDTPDDSDQNAPENQSMADFAASYDLPARSISITAGERRAFIAQDGEDGGFDSEDV